MMQECCAKLGFCGSVQYGKVRHVSQYIPKSGRVTADQFAHWVITAEGMENSAEGLEWHKPLRKIFIKHMGGEIVDAGHLQFDE